MKLGMRRRVLRIALHYILGVGAILGLGCTLQLKLGEGPPEQETGPLPLLPDPGDGLEDDISLDAAQQARKEEADRYTAEVIYKGGTIVASLLLPSGEVVDLIDRNTVPGLPHALPTLPVGPEALVLPPGVEYGLLELLAERLGMQRF